MIDLKHKDGSVKMHYECTFKVSMELCMANVECLLRIALADPDEHIEQMGGEAHLLELMNGYLDLYDRLKVRELLTELEDSDECETCKFNNNEWDSPECDGCTKADSNYEPMKDCQWMR